MKIDLIVGARPNYMKAAPVYRALQKYPQKFKVRLVHTGQHYDEKMSHIFFRELELPQPDVYLGVGSGLHGEQTGKIMIEYEKAVLADQPDLVLVAGDVNSTMACSLVAAKLHIKVGHIEGGLRSRDWSMPEEINRIVTDRIADYLFTTSKDADENLIAEGILPEKIFLVGNTMIDSLNYYLPKARQVDLKGKYPIEDNQFILVTLHRPSNVDHGSTLQALIKVFCQIQERLPIIFPMHPRTRKMLTEFDLNGILEKAPNLIITEPLGYLEFLKLEATAALVLTDSGGMQEETTVLGIPCLTLRENTERPITIWEGTNELVGSDPHKVLERASAILNGERKKGKVPDYWDGHAAERLISVLLNN
ncbi:MAG: UDP-N-acetylglucosamine 2-epimerase (non-hydrolyzing) [Candidatus Marinimicrobia bacterium]|jgi:UDP-N-acetylglucosamine 2-epimerase (non-hydrolysing)|nr:UDP-N-acetylglucosamine 2-epimerase (non-hydrolyzing) [Candidatus Neomarinimicrobiota bacterium]